MAFTLTRPRKLAGRTRAMFLRVPSAETLQRLNDLEALELFTRRGGWDTRAGQAVWAEMEARDAAEKARAARAARRKTRQAKDAAKDAANEAAREKRAAARAAYDLWVHSEWLAAEAACNGYLLSKAGKAAGVDPVKLWPMSRDRAMRLASEELREHWDTHPRLTFAQYQRQAKPRRDHQ